MSVGIYKKWHEENQAGTLKKCRMVGVEKKTSLMLRTLDCFTMGWNFIKTKDLLKILQCDLTSPNWYLRKRILKQNSE